MTRNIQMVLTTIIFCFIFLLSWQLKAENVFNVGMERPQNTVRLNTNWVGHNLSVESCISRASGILAEEKYFVESSKFSAFGLKDGMTVSFRCDYKGVAFIAIGYRQMPDQATQDSTINGLVTKFQSKN